MKTRPLSLTLLAAAGVLMAASMANAAVPAKTTTDASGDVKKLGMHKNYPLPLNSIDISQYTVSVADDRVYLKVRVADLVAPKKYKEPFYGEGKAYQRIAFDLKQGNAGFSLNTTNPSKVVVWDHTSKVAAAPQGKARKACEDATGSMSLSENTAVFSVPLACLGDSAKSVAVTNVAAELWGVDTYAADAEDLAAKSTLAY